MDSMLNVMTVEGFVASEVKLTYETGKRTCIGKFYLRNPTKIGQNMYDNDFYIVVYGKKQNGVSKVYMLARDV